MTYPCKDGYYLAGDICDKEPPGYVENRTLEEIGKDANEAAGALNPESMPASNVFWDAITWIIESFSSFLIF